MNLLERTNVAERREESSAGSNLRGTKHPLGPWVVWRSAKSRWKARSLAAVCLGACGSLLGLAIWLQPDPRGLGTHTQLGWPRCGFLMVTHLPCPTCGMTTAFAHAVRGHWIRAFLAQPMGFLLALATVAGAVLSAVVFWTAKVWSINWFRLRAERLTLIVFAMFLAAWALRILIHLVAGGRPA